MGRTLSLRMLNVLSRGARSLRSALWLAASGGAGMSRGGGIVLRGLLATLVFLFLARESQRRARDTQGKQQPYRTPHRFRRAGFCPVQVVSPPLTWQAMRILQPRTMLGTEK